MELTGGHFSGSGFPHFLGGRFPADKHFDYAAANARGRELVLLQKGSCESGRLWLITVKTKFICLSRAERLGSGKLSYFSVSFFSPYSFIMAIWILRGVFLFIALGVGTSIAFQQNVFWTIPLVLLLAMIVILLDMIMPKKKVEVVSSVYFGVFIGLLMTAMLQLIMKPRWEMLEVKGPIPQYFDIVVMPLLCYVCVSVLFQTQEDFRFIIPYIEFQKDVKGNKPYLLDTSVVIDGRIADLMETGIVENQLIMPRFVLAELQGIADSSDKLKRSRGRRGLDILNRLRNDEDVEFRIYERDLPESEGQPVDMKLVLLASHLDAKVVTGDYNLNKVAKLHNVQVINLNDIANSLKPIFLPGETVQVTVVKTGEESNQGIGYLDDGTMIVIENGREYVGKNVEINVTSVLQKSAGRMIFGKFTKVVW